MSLLPGHSLFTRTRIAVLVMLSLHSLSVSAQQLVPNGNFEAYNNCPVNWSDIAYSPGYTSFPFVQNWVRPTIGSSDYFNSCCSNSATVGVPRNMMGFQVPHSGKAYAGIYAHSYGTNAGHDYQEYLTTKLSRRLVRDSVYCVRFYASVGDHPFNFSTEAAVAINKIGASFSDTIPNDQNPSYLALPLPYHIHSDTSYYLSDTGKWYEIQGSYTAKGDEEYLTIGCFGAPPSHKFLAGNPNGYSTAYYYIDDVSVMPVTMSDSTIYTVLCDSVLTLSYDSPTPPYQWNTGAKSRSIQVTTPGNYWCKGSNDCEIMTEHFVVSGPPEYDSVHNNSFICTASKTILELNSSQPSGRWKWNTGEYGRSLQVSKPGTYICTTWYDCKILHDIFLVTLDSAASPTVYDTAICQHTVAPILPMDDTGLIWYLDVSGDSGSTSQPVIPTAKPGAFLLFVARRSGSCISKKMPLTVTIMPAPDGHIAETVLECHDGTKRYTILGENLNLPNMRYNWASGDSICCINPQSDGRYIRTAINDCGSATDTFYVRSRECDNCLAFPNAFSPNGDGINEGFRAMKHCEIKDYRLLVFDRWGEQVFFTDQLSGYWNGQYGGKPAAAGTYLYFASYHTRLSDKDYIVKGSVILFR